MNRILLALVFLVGSIASAAAACTGPAIMHDFPGTAFNMSLASVPDGNCGSNVAVPTWAGGTLGAMANYGTSPGAVLVPGVNASVTASVLPTGGATSANQSTEITSLSSIATNTTALGSASSTGTGWTTATAGNSTQVLMAVGQGSPALLVQLDQTSTISGGAVTYEGTFDNTNWVTIPVAQVVNPNTFAPLTNPYTLIASTNQPFLILTQGYQSVRVRLSTVITGTATVTPFTTLLPNNPTVGALLNPLTAGTAIIGKVGIDQTTPGTTNAVSTNDPCTYGTRTNTAIATSSGTVQLIAPSGSTQVYVCSFSLIAGATAVINLVGGTGATCTTGTPVAALGSTTAASGMSLAANGGLTFGNGAGTVARTTTAGHGLCLIQSGTTALAGNIMTVQQ